MTFCNEPGIGLYAPGRHCTKEEKGDDINSPDHYTHGGMESIEIIEAKGHGKGFCYGNAMKYLHRAEYKGDEKKDLEKCIWYIKRRLKQISFSSIDLLKPDAGMCVVPARGNRVGGTTYEQEENSAAYYGHNRNEILRYCVQCDKAIKQSDTYIQLWEDTLELPFCSQGHADKYREER